jgi:hypothetical protein
MPEPTSDKMLFQIVQDLAEIKATVKNYADLELRVRDLEKARWSSAWVTGILSAAISSGVVFMIIKALG